MHQIRPQMLKAFHLYFLTITFLLCSTALMAGTEDFMRSTGKIYAVVAVLVVTFLGIIIYMIRVDKRIKKIEDQINK